MANVNKPLAFRVRPQSLDEVIGQYSLVGANGFLRKSLEKKSLFSLILYGPPGTGKTTIAEAYAKSLKVHYINLNAVTCSKKEMEMALSEAKMWQPCILIMDEVHRLDKGKQDFLLPYVESGEIYLIGATTANPYVSLNRAIRSRCRLLEVKSLTEKEVGQGIRNAIANPNGLNGEYVFSAEAIDFIAKLSGGDMRFALNMVEEASVQYEAGEEINLEMVKDIESVPNYAMDKDEDEHYDSVSALQKSIRGCDVDAALYYLARLCIAGDLDSIARRLLVTAYEDIGLANPQAVMRCQMAIEAAERVGFPEAVIPLGDAVVDLCLSPHSRSGDESIQAAMAFAGETPFMVQDYLRYMPVNTAEEDKYPYDRPDIWEHLQHLPNAFKDKKFFQLDEKTTSKYLQALNARYKQLQQQGRSADLRALKKKKK